MLDFNVQIGGDSKITQPLNLLIDTALALERKSKPVRDYLGASRLGVPCARALQYEFMQTPVCNGVGLSNFSGNTLRIFEVGHVFEELAARWLRIAGITLATCDEHGNQFGFIAAGGKIAGNIDGIVTAVPLELGVDCPALWEAKSMNNKSWNDTAKKGLTLSKPIYASQIALYQAYMEANIPGISKNPALFTAINKNTSEIYHELVPFDADLAQRMSDKAVNIIKATDSGELLPRGFSSKEFYECKICPYQDRCWAEDKERIDVGGEI